MNKHIKIANRKIGLDYPPLVIAEIGINHNGKLSIAKELVDAAYESGAEIIKHQTHIVEDEMSSEAKKQYLVIQQNLYMKLWNSVP